MTKPSPSRPPEMRYGVCSKTKGVREAPSQPSTMSSPPNGISEPPTYSIQMSVLPVRRPRIVRTCSASASKRPSAPARLTPGVVALISALPERTRRARGCEHLVGQPTHRATRDGRTDQSQHDPAGRETTRQLGAVAGELRCGEHG